MSSSVVTTAGRLAAALGLLVLALWPARAECASERAFVLVVANNGSLDPSIQPLRYADDDGARFYEWASTFADRVELLSVLDDETQKFFPQLARQARTPRRAELRAAMSRLRAEIQRAQAAGHRTTFYFYFAGHGDVGAGREGFLFLADGR